MYNREPNYGTNDYVAKCFILGKNAKSHNGNFHTDGFYLWSYNMIIGRTENSVKQILNVRWIYSVSVTTSAHVSDAISAAHKYAALDGYKIITPVSEYTGSMSSCRRFPRAGEQYRYAIAQRKTRRGIEKLYEKMGYSAPFQTIDESYGGFVIWENHIG